MYRQLTQHRLNRLGSLCALYKQVNAGHSTVKDARPIPQAPEYEDVDHLIMAMKDCVRQGFIYTMTEVCDGLSPVPDEGKEHLLLYLRKDIKDFLSAEENKKEQEVHPVGFDDNRKLKLTHCSINCQLATICEGAGHSSAASRFRQELWQLKERYHFVDEDIDFIDGEILYREVSIRMSEVLKTLDIPSRFARLLPDTDNRFPPIRLASDAGHPNTAHKLLESEASGPVSCDILKRGPVHIAVESADLELLQLALSQCRNPNRSRDIFGMTTLCIAAYVGDLDIFIRLAGTDEDIKAVDKSGRNVLCIASGAGHLPIVQHLLDRGCRPNDLGHFGSLGKYSALHAAAAGGHEAVVDLLLFYDAAALRQFKGLTPAQEAANHGHEDLARKLHGVERQQEAELRDQVDPAHQAYYPNLTPNAFVLGQSVASSPFTQTRPDHSVETGDSLMFGSLMHGSPAPGEQAFIPGHSSAHPPYQMYDELTINSVRTSLASQSSRPPSEAPSPVVNSLKRRHVPSHESSPRSSRSQPSSSSVPPKRQHTSAF